MKTSVTISFAKAAFIFMIMFLINASLQAQTLYVPGTIGSSINGNVGIGTTNAPTDKLTVIGNISVPFQNSVGAGLSDKFTYDGKSIGNFALGWYSDTENTNGPSSYLSGYGAIKFFTGTTPRMTIKSNGNVGIGTTQPPDKLTVIGSVSIPLQNSVGYGLSDKFSYDGKSISNYSLGWYSDSENSGATTSYYSGYGAIKFFTGATPRMTIKGNGNIGIGTSTPDAMLVVKGTIHTQEVKVDLQGACAPDYVFEKDYSLRSLTEIETYLKSNKHLPEVPSANDMEENGINLKEMNLLLLKKVEELTLYMIEMKKENETSLKQNKELAERVMHLENRN